MALTPITPRDRLQRIVDLGRKSFRYWWLVGIFCVVGGGVSFAFAMTRPHVFSSWSVLFYQERIQSSLLQGREETGQRNVGDRYRELLLARGQLEQILKDPKLNAFYDPNNTADTAMETAIDKLRLAIRFDPRGANAFRITYSDSDPDRAKAVTERLTKLLQDKDESLRNEQAQATSAFATTQKDQAAIELQKREHELAEFLAKHPEFAQENAGEGASIRAIRNQKAVPTGNPRLYALERQRERIQARLDAPVDAAPVIHIAGPATPEKIAAEAAVNDAERETSAAQRALDDALSKYTEKHPTVIKAQEDLAAAQLRLRHAQAAVPADADTTPVAPANAEDRAKLQKDLGTLEAQIAAEEHAAAKPADTAAAAIAATAADASTNWVVQLETQHSDLRRAVSEQRERVASLADSVFRAQMDASQKLAEAGGRLSVVDPAFKPARPSGPGKTIFLMAGMVLFLSLGVTLAIGLALIDDRIYRRADIDQLGLIPVLAVIPPADRRARRRHRDRHEDHA